MSVESQSTNPDYRIAIKPEKWFDRLLDNCGQTSGAIVIKELRQTLKGYQIYVVCAFLLALALLFQINPFDMFQYDYIEEGELAWFARFDSYFRMLAAAGFIFIPFWIYRSMAIEFKQGAFELLSITSMPAWRIVAGKLAVATIQLLIYTSILLPFMVLETNSVQIGLFDLLIRLAFIFFISIALSGFSVMLASFVNRGSWQVAGMLVVLIIGAGLLGYFFSITFLLRHISEPGSDLAETATQVIYITLFACSVLTGSFCCFSLSKLQFSSANRSAPLRLGFAMMQWALFAAIVFVLLNIGEFGITMAIYQYVGLMCLSIFGGSMLVGDMPHPSQRVTRDNLAWWKRLVWVAWLPGSRRAFLFALANHAIITALLVLVIRHEGIHRTFTRVIPGMWLGCSYIVVYIVIAWLICRPFKHNPANRAAVAGISAIGLLVIGTVVPNTISLFSDQSTSNQYAPYYVMDMGYTVIFYSRLDTNYDLTIKYSLVIASCIALLVAMVLYVVDELREQKLIDAAREQLDASIRHKELLNTQAVS